MNPENEKDRATVADPDAATGVDSGPTPQESTDAEADITRPGKADVQAYIGRQLRAVYDDVVKQPIPDRFLALMKQLEEGGTKD